MTRGLSSATKAYTGPLFVAVHIETVAGDGFNFWNGPDTRTLTLDFARSCSPYLRIPSGFRRTRSLQANSGKIELLNTDLYMQSVLSSNDFENAKCRVYLYQFGLDTGVEIFRGLLRGQKMSIDAVEFTVKPSFNPSNIKALGYEYSNICRWIFAGNSYSTVPTFRCDYVWGRLSFPTLLSEQTANIHTVNTIGNSGLSMTIDEHQDEAVVIVGGTGKGQKRRIASNTATTITVYHDFETTPDSTSKFIVTAGAYGLPKVLYTSSSGVLTATADIATLRTIGYSGLSMTTDEHASDGDDDVAGFLAVATGPNYRKIKSNTGTTITIDDDEDDFSTTPTGSTFAVKYFKCPKDHLSCEQRGKIHLFGGAPTLTPSIARNYNV